jgi:hypothetical protein
VKYGIFRIFLLVLCIFLGRWGREQEGGKRKESRRRRERETVSTFLLSTRLFFESDSVFQLGI